MRIVFMGSSSASATCLRAILRLPGLEVTGVVTQPDRRAGRGKVLTPCPCRAYAAERGINACITPENVNSPEALAQIRAWKPDVIVVVAFGQFLKEELLNLPPLGCVNCHFSLLPKYRGASPVTAALLAGDVVTGVSVIKMGIGMDDGPILLKQMEPIYSDDTGDTLMEEFAKVDPSRRNELPGTVLEVTKRGPVIRTGTTALLITALKPEGAKEMAGGVFLHGRPLEPLKDMLLAIDPEREAARSQA